jgi:hypothetical protein
VSERLEAVEGHAEPDDGGELPVVADVRALEPARPAASPAVQAAAVAATGFVAGATAVALARRRAVRKAAPARRRRKNGRGRGGELVEVVASRSFLVDVHLLNPRD